MNAKLVSWQNEKTRGDEQILNIRWTIICNAGPTVDQYLFKDLCLLRVFHNRCSENGESCVIMGFTVVSILLNSIALTSIVVTKLANTITYWGGGLIEFYFHRVPIQNGSRWCHCISQNRLCINARYKTDLKISSTLAFSVKPAMFSPNNLLQWRI